MHLQLVIVMFEKLIAIVIKELKQLIRDKRTIALVIALPLIVMITFGIAYSGEIHGVKIAIGIEDNGYPAQVVLSRIISNSAFDVVYTTDNLDTVRYYVEKGYVKAGVVIPAKFSEKLLSFGSADIITILDPGWFSIPGAVQSKLTEIAQEASREIRQYFYAEYKTYMDISISVVPFYLRGELKIIDIVGPAVMGIMVQQVPLTLASISIVREREKGTLEKLLTTPIGRFDLIFGKLIPYAIVGILIGIGELFIVTEGLGAINYGNPIDITIVSFMLAIASLGLGLFFSIVSRNQLQAMQFSTFMMILSYLFSGFLLPLEGIRLEARFIVYAMPLYYFYQAIGGLTLRGLRLIDVLDQVIYLAIYAAITLSLSLILMSKRIE